MSPDERNELDSAMARLAAGDRSLLEPVMRRLEAPVRRVCVRMLGSGADADDAAQEALVELFGKISEYDPRRDGLAWALTIAAWECRTIRRRRTRSRTTALEPESIANGRRGPIDELEENELRAALAEAIADMRPADREVLDQVMDELRGDAAFRKRKERMIDRLRALVRRTYDLDL